MRAASMVLVGAAVAAVAPRPAAAQVDSDVPEVRFAILLGGRVNTGDFGDQFGPGGMWGFEAGWQPNRLGIAWSIGWSVPRWTAGLIGVVGGGSFESTDPARVDEYVGLTEMSLGLRLRWPVGEGRPRFLLGSAGATVMRTSIPIPPDSTREYIGPYAGAGIEQLLAGRYMVALEARYGMFLGGPAGLTINASLAFGSR